MIDNMLLIGYLIFLLVIGYFSGKKLKTARDFALSDRPFGLITMISTIFASFFGGTNLFGVPERMYEVGIIFILCFLGNAVNVFLIARTVIDPMSKYKDAIDLGDIAYEMYGKWGRILVAVCNVVVSAGIVGAQMGVIGAVGRDFLQIDSDLAIAVGCCVFVLYSGFGGLKAVAFTDLVQFFVFAIILPIVVSIVLQKVGNINDLWQAIPDSHKTILRPDLGNYILLFIFFCCPGLDPAFVQRILVMGERSREIAKKAFIILTILTVIYAILLAILGGCAILIPNIKPESAFGTVVDNALSPGMKGVLGIGILAITMSFADSDLNVGSISLARGIIKNVFFPDMSDKTELFLMRVSTIVFGVAAYFVAKSSTDLLQIIFFFNNFWMPLVVIPIYFGLYGLKVSTKVFLWASACAAFATIYWMIYMPNELDIESIIVGMIVDLVIMTGGYWYEKKNHKMIFAKK